MTDSDKDFTGSIPEIYDEYLVPLIFEYYAQDIAERVAKINPVSVLETAAGSGVVARALIEVLWRTVRAPRYATKLSSAMLTCCMK